MKENRQNEKGFSFIELVTVIAIIAVLATLLLPRILYYIEDAEKSKELASARTIAGEITAINAQYIAREEAIPFELDVLYFKNTSGPSTGDLMSTPLENRNEELPSGKYAQIKVDNKGNASVLVHGDVGFVDSVE